MSNNVKLLKKYSDQVFVIHGQKIFNEYSVTPMPCGKGFYWWWSWVNILQAFHESKARILNLDRKFFNNHYKNNLDNSFRKTSSYPLWSLNLYLTWGQIFHHRYMTGLTPAPWVSESCIKIKINLNFYYHTSLWWLKRFYKGLQDLHKTF